MFVILKNIKIKYMLEIILRNAHIARIMSKSGFKKF